jgi:hypothetical protein
MVGTMIDPARADGRQIAQTAFFSFSTNDLTRS